MDQKRMRTVEKAQVVLTSDPLMSTNKTDIIGPKNVELAGTTGHARPEQ